MVCRSSTGNGLRWPAALDQRVDYVLAFCPALCDLTGFFSGRAAGWPNMFNASNSRLDATKDKIKTSGYYDVVNFARLLTIPGYYSWGFNDETTPPTSMYAAYNVITAPKDLYLVPEVAHTISPDQSRRWADWIVSKLTDE
jgi:cephalosporin-C deacetylase